VKITDITVHVLKSPLEEPFAFSQGWVRQRATTLVEIKTDTGLSGWGEAFAQGLEPPEIAATVIDKALRPLLMGADPLDIEVLWYRMYNMTRDYGRKGSVIAGISAVDIALWDIAGRVAGLPIHRLLGTRRNSLPAYASSSTLHSIDDYVQQALESKAAGYRAYKMHPPKDRALHIPMLRQVREAVGDDFPLMYDPAAIYSYADALKIGRILEELNYVWYEDPMPVDDMYNYTKLCADLDIMVMTTEYSWGGFLGYPAWISARATDALRGDVALKGGITGVVKSIHLAEAFNMKYELHHGGNSLNNIANAHVALATANCDYFEVILPDIVQKYAVINELALDENGHISPPDGPGLGAQINFELIERMKVTVMR